MTELTGDAALNVLTDLLTDYIQLKEAEGSTSFIGYDVNEDNTITLKFGTLALEILETIRLEIV